MSIDSRSFLASAGDGVGYDLQQRRQLGQEGGEDHDDPAPEGHPPGRDAGQVGDGDAVRE